MKITIEGTPEEIKELLQAIASSEEQSVTKNKNFYGPDKPAELKAGDNYFDTKALIKTTFNDAPLNEIVFRRNLDTQS